MNDLIKRHSSVGDILEVIHPQTKNKIVGKVTLIELQANETKDLIHLRIFKKAGDFDHPPIPSINTHAYPILAQASAQEVFETSEELQVKRCNIIDIAFVLPADLVANGTYHCIGMMNAYFVHFSISLDGSSLIPTSVMQSSNEVILPLSK